MRSWSLGLSPRQKPYLFKLGDNMIIAEQLKAIADAKEAWQQYIDSL